MKLQIDLFAYKPALDLLEAEGKTYFKDPVRKKLILLQPEELVRQLWMRYLNGEHGVAFSSMAVEKSLTIGESSRRYDLVIYDKAEPKYLFEFKSFKVPLDESTCLQIAQYNLSLNIPFLIMSNGIDSYAYQVDHEQGRVDPLANLPF